MLTPASSSFLSRSMLLALLTRLDRSTIRHILPTTHPNTGTFRSSCLAKKRKIPGKACALMMKSRAERWLLTMMHAGWFLIFSAPLTLTFINISVRKTGVNT